MCRLGQNLRKKITPTPVHDPSLKNTDSVRIWALLAALLDNMRNNQLHNYS